MSKMICDMEACSTTNNDAPIFNFLLIHVTHNILAREIQWYLNHFISTFGESPFNHQPDMMVHLWIGLGLQTAVLC